MMHEEFPDADYIVIEGGTNDADLHSHIEDRDLRGSFDPYDFSGDYDRTTFAGALESIFYRASKYWLGKKICYIVAHKMTWGKCFVNRRSYFDLAIEICKKWGIPYLDLWNGCYLNSSLPWMYDKEKSGEENEAMLCRIRESGARIVFVCFGAPAQEMWIARNREKLPLVNLLLGLGGSLDVYSGHVKRAPAIFVRLGLEWLYRLLKEPKRIGRMMSLPKFYFGTWKHKLFGKRKGDAR